mgnify:CR=1 FL=1
MKYVGQSIPRNDGFDKVTGRGLFTFDVTLPRMVYGKVLRSPYAHAKVLSIDTSEAEALPGVRAVCTFKNTTNKVWNGAAPMFITPLPHKPVLDQAIFTDEPKYIGDEVAAVAADTEAIAEQAVKRHLEVVLDDRAVEFFLDAPPHRREFFGFGAELCVDRLGRVGGA